MNTTDSARPSTPAPETTAFRTIPLGQMQKALAAGEAAPLSQTITDIMRYESTWWLYDRDGWVLVDNEQLSNGLDAAARHMAVADQLITNNLQHRFTGRTTREAPADNQWRLSCPGRHP